MRAPDSRPSLFSIRAAAPSVEFFIVPRAKPFKHRRAYHGFAQFAQKDAQADKILFREGGEEVIGQGRNGHVHFARIQHHIQLYAGEEEAAHTERPGKTNSG